MGVSTEFTYNWELGLCQMIHKFDGAQTTAWRYFDGTVTAPERIDGVETNYENLKKSCKKADEWANQIRINLRPKELANCYYDIVIKETGGGNVNLVFQYLNEKVLKISRKTDGRIIVDPRPRISFHFGDYMVWRVLIKIYLQVLSKYES